MAAQWTFEQAWGKPPQYDPAGDPEASPPLDVTVLTPEQRDELRLLINLMRAGKQVTEAEGYPPKMTDNVNDINCLVRDFRRIPTQSPMLTDEKLRSITSSTITAISNRCSTIPSGHPHPAPGETRLAQIDSPQLGLRFEGC